MMTDNLTSAVGDLFRSVATFVSVAEQAKAAKTRDDQGEQSRPGASTAGG